MIDVEINFEKIIKTLPDGVSPATVGEYLESVIEQVNQIFQELKPDETFVHSDAITVKKISVDPRSPERSCFRCGNRRISMDHLHCIFCGNLSFM